MSSIVSIKMCKKNLEKFSQPVFDMLKQEYPDQEIEVEDCVGQEFCSLCHDVPFLIRNNAVIHGRDARDLYYKVDKGLRYLKKDQEQTQS